MLVGGTVVLVVVLDGVVLADLALVFDICEVLVVLVHVVVHNLGAAVRKLDLVLACKEKKNQSISTSKGSVLLGSKIPLPWLSTLRAADSFCAIF